VGGTLVDMLTGMLLIAGLVIALFRVHKRAERLALVWFGLGMVAIPISSYTQGVHLTRLLYLIPPVALLAGIAVSKLDRVLRASFRLPSGLAHGLVLVLLALVPPLN